MRTSNDTTVSLRPRLAAPSRPAPVSTSGLQTVPIYVIGGFLGSGKTTLLKRLVQRAMASSARPAVVMNELSDSNVDGALLHDQENEDAFEMRSILNGCVCCDLSEELTDEVRGLLRTSRGPIFVETTGLASVAQTADAVASALAGGGRQGRLASVITVVDARRFADLRRMGRDPAADIRAADTVVINKVDELSARAAQAVEATVRTLNPVARIFTSAFADIPPAELLVAPRPDIAPPLRAKGRDEKTAASMGEFVSVTATMLGPVLVDRLARVLARYRNRIARVKGFVRTTETWGLQELQWVPGALEVRPWKKGRGLRPHLVIVGRRIDWDRFVVDLDSCVQMPALDGERNA